MKKQDFSVVMYKEGAYFVAQILEVDVSSFGKTEKEATAAVTEALQLYLEDSQNQKMSSVKNPKLQTLHLQNA